MQLYSVQNLSNCTVKKCFDHENVLITRYIVLIPIHRHYLIVYKPTLVTNSCRVVRVKSGLSPNKFELRRFMLAKTCW